MSLFLKFRQIPDASIFVFQIYLFFSRLLRNDKFFVENSTKNALQGLNRLRRELPSVSFAVKCRVRCQSFGGGRR